jgi:hypothetical protein
MSEYQYIEFRAVDRPLTEKELAYAEKQSSRAEISKRRFANEYNYSSFRGNVNGLLKQGYDVFLEYTNYGNRTLKMRLPHGFPFDGRVTRQFFDKHLLQWEPDNKGKPNKAGILTMEPYLEMPDPVWEFDDYIEQAIALRKLLMAGDLRALYLCWLFVAADENHGWDEAIEPPVPVGLDELATDFPDLFLFFELDPLLVRAAAENAKITTKTGTGSLPDLSKMPSLKGRIAEWTKSLSANEARSIVAQFLTDDETSVKAELLAKLPESEGVVSWPTLKLKRTFKDLCDATEQLRLEQDAKDEKKAAAKAKREDAKARKAREQRMIEMVSDPQKWINATEVLVDERGTDNYEQAAEILADMQEALTKTKSSNVARKHAAHLARKHPTLTRLKGALRKHGVLD